jgi:hypothetical protein
MDCSKRQAPNSKHQIPNKFKTANDKRLYSGSAVWRPFFVVSSFVVFPCFVFVVCLLFDAWCLEFGLCLSEHSLFPNPSLE